MMKFWTGHPVAFDALALASSTIWPEAPPKSIPTSTAQALPSSTTMTLTNRWSRMESVAITKSLSLGVMSALAAPARKRPETGF